MQSFFETKLSEKMQRTCYATKTKETCERERLAYSTSELVLLELSKKTNRLAAQKDHENYKVNFNSAF